MHVIGFLNVDRRRMSLVELDSGIRRTMFVWKHTKIEQQPENCKRKTNQACETYVSTTGINNKEVKYIAVIGFVLVVISRLNHATGVATNHSFVLVSSNPLMATIYS